MKVLAILWFSLGNEPNISQTFTSDSGIQPVDVKNLFSIDSKIPKKKLGCGDLQPLQPPDLESPVFWNMDIYQTNWVTLLKKKPLKGWKSQFFFRGHWKQSLWKKILQSFPKTSVQIEPTAGQFGPQHQLLDESLNRVLVISVVLLVHCWWC